LREAQRSRWHYRGADLPQRFVSAVAQGPREKVDISYQRIQRDRRHLEVKLLSRRNVTERLFPGWAMRNDPARSWMWNQAEVDADAINRATEAEAVAIFERLAREPA
jgi:hypothetical protein